MEEQQDDLTHLEGDPGASSSADPEHQATQDSHLQLQAGQDALGEEVQEIQSQIHGFAASQQEIITNQHAILEQLQLLNFRFPPPQP